MAGKPTVFKMAGAWIWRCRHTGGWTGAEYLVDRWPHPWAACHADAIRHHALYHPSGSEPVEEAEIP